jgi:hypothetical protein
MSAARTPTTRSRSRKTTAPAAEAQIEIVPKSAGVAPAASAKTGTAP